MTHTTADLITGQLDGAEREPSATANLSLRHVLTPRLSMVMNVTDVFDSGQRLSKFEAGL